MKDDLSKLSLNELKELRKKVDNAISSFEERKKTEARAKLEAQAKELGFTLDELVGGKTRRAKAPAKYRNPDDPKQTWSGRGRRPNWLEAALKNGAKLEDFLIG